MYKVMIRDNMSPAAAKILEATGMIQVVVDNDKTYNDPQKLAEIIGEFHGLAVRSGTRVTEEVLARAPHLTVIGRAGIGVDNIDVPAATRQGVVVMNAPGGNTVTTAEHAIAMMLSLARHVPRATASLREARWEKKQFTGVEIAGKTLGVIGLGHIGRVVADRARGLKMTVIATDPYVSPEAAKAAQVDLVPLDELLARSDFVSLHVPRLKETAHMIDADTLRLMKPGARLINCSRGEVVDLDALYEAVAGGHLAGAALDVFPKEPPDFSHPVFQHPHMVFTPHLGASTGEAQVKVAEMIAEQMTAYLQDGIITHAVNFPSLSKDVLTLLRPYLDLAEKMGALMGQLVRCIRDLTVTFSGEVTKLDTRPLTNAVLKGLLGSFTDKPINHVSAPIIAREKGIHVRETISQARSDFADLIQVKLESHEGGPDEIWGTIFSRKYPRIVRLGQIYMDAIPEGSMIIIQNYDRPGVIGNVGSLLGKRGINIARFHLGRSEDIAYCMVNIDTPAEEAVLQEIRALPNIISACQVVL